MTRFARKCVKNAVVLTSAPLTNGGMVDISTTPRDAFVGAGSKGREYIDTKGQLGRFPIDPAQQAKLDEFNTRIAALIREPQYEKFALIGSGYQKKFGQVTIARQDMNNSVDAEESRAFLAKIESLLTEIDPERKFFRTEDTGKDIEVLLTVKEDSSDGQLRDFDKGDGVMFLNSSLNLDVARGPNLVCGDTHSDVPMLTACVSACTNTWGVFVTTNEDLKKNVKDATRQSVCVDEPDVLVSALNALAQ